MTIELTNNAGLAVIVEGGESGREIDCCPEHHSE